MAITIKTNHHEREVLQGFQLTEAERVDFSYYSWPGDEPQHPEPTRRGEDAEFVRYRGRLYDLNDTEGAPPFAPGWDMYISDSFFSGILFRYPRSEWMTGVELETDYVVCATYYAS